MFFGTLPVEFRSILQKNVTSRHHPIEAKNPPEKGSHGINWFTSFCNTATNNCHFKRYDEYAWLLKSSIYENIESFIFSMDYKSTGIFNKGRSRYIWTKIQVKGKKWSTASRIWDERLGSYSEYSQHWNHFSQKTNEITKRNINYRTNISPKNLVKMFMHFVLLWKTKMH